MGVIGPNGAGKTTLFRMITGEEQPDHGSLRVGPTVELGYVDQSRDALVADHTVFQEISGGHDTLEMGGRKINARAYVSRFNFRGPDQEKKVGTFRAANATACIWPSCCGGAATCCCSTSRPTTWTSTRSGLWKKPMLNFAGCVVVISHDRWFLDRIATHILAFEGDAYVHWCEGNFQTYETTADGAAGSLRVGAAAIQVQAVAALNAVAKAATGRRKSWEPRRRGSSVSSTPRAAGNKRPPTPGLQPVQSLPCLDRGRSLD